MRLPYIAPARAVSQRSFLRVSAAAAAGGLLVSFRIDRFTFAQETGGTPRAGSYPPDAFVHIRPDGRIVIKCNHAEIGQGVGTALPMILADELDADWSQVTAELAPAADVYKDPVYGFQNTGGSASI